MSALNRSPSSGQYLTLCSGLNAVFMERKADCACGSFATCAAKFFSWASVTGLFVNPWVTVDIAEILSAWDPLGLCGAV